MRKVLLAAVMALIGLFICNGPSGEAAKSKFSLDTLSPGHPRIMAVADDDNRVRELIRTDPEAAALYKRIKARADELLDEPAVDFTAVDYRDNIVKVRVMLGKVRQSLDRVQVLLTVRRISGDVKYADRAKLEIEAAAALPDWNRMHFLDTAEMTHMFAIAYDWMYDDLTESERKLIRDSIIEKAFGPALSAYRTGGGVPWGYWVRARHNWSQVCNGGLALGALAIAGEEPEIASEIMDYALTYVQLPMAEFAPDGAWGEGPSYWSYATQYNVYLLAGLQTALGTDYGLSQMEGFPTTGDFRIHATGPFLHSFNYADAHSPTHADEQLFWLARQFDEPAYSWMARQYLAGNGPMALWWWDGRDASLKEFPLDAYFSGAEVVFMRSAWDDPRALFVGFKGGDNKTNHSHLDLGTFVFDARGVRWAVDLGKDSYKLPFYFDVYLGQRWQYYRNRTEGHNTLLIDGKNQGRRAEAEIIKFDSKPERSFAVADLTDGYGAKVKRIWRGLAMLDRSKLLIQDEIEAFLPVEVVWGFHTEASVEINGRQATLSQDGEKLLVRIVEPADAFFVPVDPTQPPPENPNEGATNLTVRLPGKVTSTRIVVELVPCGEGCEAPVGDKVTKLRDW